jgi:hypothetical protein
MKKILLVLALLLAISENLLLSPSTAWCQTQALVNGVWVTSGAIPIEAQAPHAAVSSGAVSSLTNAFGSSNTVGNTIVVVAGVGNGGTATISDTNSNTYTLAVKQALSTTFAIEIFVAVNVKAGSNTVTVTPTASVSVASEIYEFQGLLTITSTAGGTAQANAAVIDQMNTGTATSTALSTGSVFPSNPNEWAIAGFAVGTAAQTITVASPYTNDSGQQNVGGTPSGLYSFVSASNYLATNTPTVASGTITSEPWVAAIATFRTVSVPVIASQRQVNSDPCGSSVWTYYPINVSSNTQVVASLAGENVYLCEYYIQPVTAAANVNIVEGTGTTCGTNTAGMLGGATAALGAVLTTNGGFVLPPAGRAYTKTATVGDAMCIFTSAAVEGVLAYVQQ